MDYKNLIILLCLASQCSFISARSKIMDFFKPTSSPTQRISAPQAPSRLPRLTGYEPAPSRLPGLTGYEPKKSELPAVTGKVQPTPVSMQDIDLSRSSYKPLAPQIFTNVAGRYAELSAQKQLSPAESTERKQLEAIMKQETAYNPARVKQELDRVEAQMKQQALPRMATTPEEIAHNVNRVSELLKNPAQADSQELATLIKNTPLEDLRPALKNLASMPLKTQLVVARAHAAKVLDAAERTNVAKKLGSINNKIGSFLSKIGNSIKNTVAVAIPRVKLAYKDAIKDIFISRGSNKQIPATINALKAEQAYRKAQLDVAQQRHAQVDAQYQKAKNDMQAFVLATAGKSELSASDTKIYTQLNNDMLKLQDTFAQRSKELNVAKNHYNVATNVITNLKTALLMPNQPKGKKLQALVRIIKLGEAYRQANPELAAQASRTAQPKPIGLAKPTAGDLADARARLRKTPTTEQPSETKPTEQEITKKSSAEALAAQRAKPLPEPKFSKPVDEAKYLLEKAFPKGAITGNAPAILAEKLSEQQIDRLAELLKNPSVNAKYDQKGYTGLLNRAKAEQEKTHQEAMDILDAELQPSSSPQSKTSRGIQWADNEGKPLEQRREFRIQQTEPSSDNPNPKKVKITEGTTTALYEKGARRRAAIRSGSVPEDQQQKAAQQRADAADANVRWQENIASTQSKTTEPQETTKMITIEEILRQAESSQTATKPTQQELKQITSEAPTTPKIEDISNDAFLKDALLKDPKTLSDEELGRTVNIMIEKSKTMTAEEKQNPVFKEMVAEARLREDLARAFRSSEIAQQRLGLQQARLASAQEGAEKLNKKSEAIVNALGEVGRAMQEALDKGDQQSAARLQNSRNELATQWGITQEGIQVKEKEIASIKKKIEKITTPVVSESTLNALSKTMGEQAAPTKEDQDWAALQKSLLVEDSSATVPQDAVSKVDPAEAQRIDDLFADL